MLWLPAADGPSQSRTAVTRCTLIACALWALACGTSPAPAPERPNFVIVFLDDVGYGDLVSYGSQKNSTPRLDRMAREGTRFTSFYAQTVCGPSRGALMTARYPGRVGSGWAVRPDEVTVAEVLGDAGYSTAVIGKWDMSRRRPLEGLLPNDQGFDYFFGTLGANDNGTVTFWRDKQQLETTDDMGSLTKLYTDEAIGFLRQQQKGEPFFLYLSHTMLHVVIGASEEFGGTTEGDLYGDALAELDYHTGRVLDELETLGLAEDTYVLLTSDNGPWSQPARVERYFESHGGHLATGDSGGLRGAKGSSWEGGVRVPAIVWGPGRVPAGRESDAIVSTLDVMPTFAALAGTSPPADLTLDGVDQSALWRGGDDSGARDRFHYFVRMELHAVRRGRWKLAMPRERFHGYAPDVRAVDQPQLYDLHADVGETTDVASQNPEIVAELRALYDEMRAESADWAPWEP